MLPFKVFDREKKITWLVINYHPGEDGGSYLVSREDDTAYDGQITTMTTSEIEKLKMVGFLEEGD